MIRTSCLLFHGPGARQKALDHAHQYGRLLHEPFGDEGLAVGDAREFVALLQSPPVGDDLGAVVAGPLDHAAPKSTDVLLKTIEEPFPYVLPVLWALDLGGVAATIQSRCLPIWSPATGTEVVNEVVEDTARELVGAILAGQLWQVPGLVSKVKSTEKQRGREVELVGEVVEALFAQHHDPRVILLWDRVRELASWRNPTQVELLAAFCGGRG